MKRHIPNMLTMGNLLCGVFACIFAYKAQWGAAAALFMVGVVFDYFDGFAARMLHVKSELGKELDSLADLITSGLAPALVMFSLMKASVVASGYVPDEQVSLVGGMFIFSRASLFALPAFLIVVFSALRLAKFNLDTRQSESFIGLPTPANGLILMFLPFIVLSPSLSVLNHYTFFLVLTLVCSYLLVSPLRLFALKFKNFSWRDNKVRWIFIGFCAVLLAGVGVRAFPLIIVLYVLMSGVFAGQKN